MNVANALTLFRLFLSPALLVAFAFWDHLSAQFCALGIACLSEGSDILDGHLARNRAQITDFGKLIDPMADSISRLTAFLCFAGVGYVPVWMVVCILYRDSIVATLRTIAAVQNIVVAARPSGKIKAVVQGTAILTVLVLSILHQLYQTPHYAQIVHGLMALVTGVTVLSGVDYLMGNWAVVRKVWTQAG